MFYRTRHLEWKPDGDLSRWGTRVPSVSCSRYGAAVLGNVTLKETRCKLHVLSPGCFVRPRDPQRLQHAFNVSAVPLWRAPTWTGDRWMPQQELANSKARVSDGLSGTRFMTHITSSLPSSFCLSSITPAGQWHPATKHTTAGTTGATQEERKDE